MPASLTCPACATRFQVARAALHWSIRCPQCGCDFAPHGKKGPAEALPLVAAAGRVPSGPSTEALVGKVTPRHVDVAQQQLQTCLQTWLAYGLASPTRADQERVQRDWAVCEREWAAVAADRSRLGRQKP